MSKFYFIAALSFTLISCDAIHKNNVKGVYSCIDKGKGAHDEIEFTDTKCMMPDLLGEGMALEYTVEDNYVYVNIENGVQTKFKIIDTDTLRGEGFIKGTYVREAE